MENIKEEVQKNFDWFGKNKQKFYSSPDSKYVLVSDCRFVGTFKSSEDAYKYAARESLPPGFIVQEIDDDKKIDFFGYYSSIVGQGNMQKWERIMIDTMDIAFIAIVCSESWDSNKWYGKCLLLYRLWRNLLRVRILWENKKLNKSSYWTKLLFSFFISLYCFFWISSKEFCPISIEPMDYYW